MIQIDESFAENFKTVAENFGAGLAAGNPVVTAYQLGIAAGMLITILPEEEAQELIELQEQGMEVLYERIEWIFNRALELINEGLVEAGGTISNG